MDKLLNISDSILYVCVDANLKVVDYNSFYRASFLHVESLYDIINPDDLDKFRKSLKGKNVTIRVKRGFKFELIRICVDKLHLNHYHILGVFLSDAPSETRSELRRLTRLLEDLQISFSHIFLKHLANIQGGLQIIESAEDEISRNQGLEIAKAASMSLREAISDGIKKYRI